jgi:hypothetical protein
MGLTLDQVGIVVDDYSLAQQSEFTGCPVMLLASNFAEG